MLHAILGPLVLGVVDYPISESMNNQLIGLEIVTAIIVAPSSFLAGVLALRGHRAAGVIAFGPAAFTAYMFAQYVLGPEYADYRIVVFFELGVFVLGTVVAMWAWTIVAGQSLPALTRRKERLYGAVLLAMAAFVLSRSLSTGPCSGAGRYGRSARQNRWAASNRATSCSQKPRPGCAAPFRVWRATAIRSS